MKLGIAVLLVVAGSVAMVAHQTKTPPPPTPAAKTATAPMDRAALEKALIANEQKVNDAFARNDVPAFKALVDTAAVAMDESGVLEIADYVKALEGKQAKVTDQKLESFRVVWIDANSAAVTYKWSGKGTFAGQPVKSPSYASTIWTKKGDKWVAVFHHETPAMTTPMPAPKKK